MTPLPPRLLAALALATFGTGVIAAEITFWESPGYRSRSFASTQTIPNFADIGFNDRASSVVIRSGTWQLCTDAYFRGRCVTLDAGEYPTLASMGLDNAVSSARELGGWPGGGGVGGDRGVVLFDSNGFSGRNYDVNGTIVDFDRLGFNDQARSMIIYQGTWELCQHGQFGGYCQTYGPGRYAGLGRLSGEVSSIRPAGGGGGGWGAGTRAILYEGPDLTGRSFVISNQVMANLDGSGFNDRASSLRIEGGYWIFCSDAQFNGECQTFGPGDYPRLSWGLENRISSGRRIHGHYPYSTTPNWSAPR